MGRSWKSVALPARIGTFFAALLSLLLLGIGGAQDIPQEEPLSVAWSRPQRDIVALAISAEGSRLVAADANGFLRCWDQAGELCWERRMPGVDQLSISRDGSLTLAYASRQPRRRQVSFLDRAGRLFYVMEAPAPVSMALASQDGRFAAVAAGASVLFWGRGPRGVRQRRIVLEGKPRQIQFGPGDSIYAACLDLGCVIHIKSTGHVLWRHNLPERRLSSISASENGRLLAIAGEHPEGGVTVTLIDSQDTTHWSVTRPGRAPLVRLAADGNAALLAYEHRFEHNSERRFLRRLYFGAPGPIPGEAQELWTKGGAFTAPYYVSVDRKGEWVVALDAQAQRADGSGQPTFRLYGRSGERKWMYASPTGILIAIGSTDGRHIAAYRADGVVELLRVAAR